MKPVLAAIFAALLAALVAPGAGADTFVAAGHSFPSPAPFRVVADKQEVLAPAAAALRCLGVQVSTADRRIELRAPNGSILAARVASQQALVGGVERMLPAAPAFDGGHLYLPVRSVAWHLGLAYRWDEQSRTIFLHARVSDVTFSRLPDKVRVKITGSAALTYSAGVLKQPPRIYVDISNADLFAAEQQVAVNEADLIGIRASQHSLNPDLVRVVLDLKQEPVEYFHSAADGGRSIVVDIPAPKLGAPAQGTVCTVAAVRLEQRQDSLCALVVEADGTPVTALSVRRSPPQVVVELSNVRLQSEQVDGSHPLVAAASAEQVSESAARIVLDLARPQAAALARRADGVRVLIGSVPLSAVTVVLDPGHGGRQPGAIGPSGLEEKTVNLAVALRAEKLLRRLGAQVVLTRREDSSLIPVTCREELRRELALRAEVANRCRAGIFVSIHCNASPQGTRRSGSETYYCTARSLGLAKVMQQELVRQLRLNDGGIHAAHFVVIREARMPAALVELAYLNDPREEALLGSPDFQERAAQALAAGVQRFAEEGGLLQYYAELESSRLAPGAGERAREEPQGMGGSEDDGRDEPDSADRAPVEGAAVAGDAR